MTRFKYLVLEYDISNLTPDRLEGWLDEFGAKGWQVVDIYADPSAPKLTVTFMREMVETKPPRKAGLLGMFGPLLGG